MQLWESGNNMSDISKDFINVIKMGLSYEKELYGIFVEISRVFSSNESHIHGAVSKGQFNQMLKP